MSFIKILKAPSKLFQKDVITFLTIRRHDLGVIDNKLHYISVKPTASISVLRQKVWHLLDLPDYCDEIIKLESEDGKELPLTDLRTGNEPQHPYILEVWLPVNQSCTPIIKTTVAMKTKNDNKANTLPSDCKSEVCSKISSTSLFFKLHGRKSRDNFTNILLKIQNDLIVLSNKLSTLENKIQI
ncbi:uncharacterized protein LOC110993242 isoform X2 [Pieris rapae]|uniref:uncharacterized protein LOC110993242 isoform X2 n=1 Tax=Pieris rapae TaxID=64459 RepID=UPI001E27B016|nr:uncharacterized protein LOC110993242 isoform X2 [Pieris rapae]